MSAPPTDPWITHVLGEDDAESDFFSSDNDVESDNHSNDHGDKAVYSREEVSALLPVREVAMMDIMSKLTDKPEWDRKVFDEDIVAKWKEEAMALPDDVWVKIAAAEGSEWIRPRESRFPRPRPIPGILSEEAWNYCIKELRSKARYHKKTGLVPSLDAIASVVKSDKLVDSDLHDALESAFKTLLEDQKDDPDWHPNSNDMVRNLVHPSMYPLVYGQSRVLQEAVVGVEDAISSWAGKGEVIPKSEKLANRGDGWSATYQWLPANIAFEEDGSVKFTSYINNLHPTKYPSIYSTIEKLIEKALPAWNQCLLERRDDYVDGPGRLTSRFPIPDELDDDDERNWTLPFSENLKHATLDPEDDDPQYHGQEDNDEWFDENGDDAAGRKWKLLRRPVLREPDPYKEVNYNALPSVHSLFQKFKDKGLQIIVKMASVELTPEKPEFPAGSWHVEGLQNEQICATALYYLDSENITDSSLSFRMKTAEHQSELYEAAGQDRFKWLECYYATDLRAPNCAVQNYGTVLTRPRRLLAFPNIFQHRVSSFKLVDPTKPGYRRFIALWLVEPHTRILSTANVPPQRLDWWAEAAFGQKSTVEYLPSSVATLLREKGVEVQGTDAGGARRLPDEVMNMVREEMKDIGLMGREEAEKHRLKLMKERSVRAHAGWEPGSYNFCEH